MTASLVFKPRTANFTSVAITHEEPAKIHRQLREKLAHAPAGFFHGAPMVADLGALENPDTKWLSELKNIFKAQGLILIGLSHHRFSLEALLTAGLADIAPAAETHGTTSEKTRNKTNTNPTATANNLPYTTVIHKPIRSGQRIYARGGDLIVIGTVGAGAEVIADGNIHVLGSLRGRAFAGAQGDENSHIFCNELSAELASIAGSYQNMEQLEAYKSLKNCLITLNKDETMSIVSL